MRAVALRISGKVQGVGFRAWTKRTARALGIFGWVRNEPDGSVLVHAEGDPGLIDQFITACHMGPPTGAVSGVTLQDATPEGATKFEQR